MQIKKIIAAEIEKEISSGRISKSAMAERLGTSRSQLDRLLNPGSESITLISLVRAAGVLGKSVSIRLATNPVLKSSRAPGEALRRARVRREA